jgi:hypothetical protein
MSVAPPPFAVAQLEQDPRAIEKSKAAPTGGGKVQGGVQGGPKAHAGGGKAEGGAQGGKGGGGEKQ